MALLLARFAHAATPEEDFNAGVAAFEDGDFATACPAFRRSFDASDSKGALYQLARCEDEGRGGRLATSLKLWKQVTERYQDDPEILGEAATRQRDLESKAPRIVLRRAASADREVRFTLDGAPAPSDAPLLLDAGPHKLAASADGYPTQTVDVLLRDGESRTIEFDPGKRLEPQPLVTPPPPGRTEGTEESDSSLRTAGFILGGIGVGGLVLFGVSSPIIASAESDLDASCPSRVRCSAEAIEASDRGKAWLVPNTVGLIAGVVGVGLGVTFIVLGSDDGGSDVAVGPTRIELRQRF